MDPHELLHEEGRPHSALRGVTAALRTEPVAIGGGFLGGAEINFAEAMRAFMEQSEFDGDADVRVRAPNAKPSTRPDMGHKTPRKAKKKKKGEKAVTLKSLVADRAGESDESSSDGEEETDTILSSLVEAPAPPEDDGRPRDEKDAAAAAPGGMLLGDLVEGQDEELGDAPDALTHLDFEEVDPGALSLGSRYYYQEV